MRRASSHPAAGAALDRRGVLRAALAASSTLWLPRAAWSQPALADQPFGLGVASGSPTHDGVVLWTRLWSSGFFGASSLPDTPITVRWELAHDEAFREIAAKGQAQALPALAHSVHVEVGGLTADRGYFYRFMVGGKGNDWVSPVGRTRTLPAPDAAAARLRLVYASCQRWEHGHYAAWRGVVRDAPDLVLFLGDYIYEYPGAANAVRPVDGGWVLTLDDYRRRHAQHKTDPALQAAHALCPWFVTWDDHEVQNDYAGLVPGDSGPPVANFTARRAAAYQAFYEHLPLRANVLTRALAGLGSGAEMRIYGSARWGRLAALHLLDGRQYRDAQACTPGGKFGSGTLDPSTCESWNDPKRTFLGAAQEAWLAQSLAQQGDATWSVLGQSTLFGERDHRPGPGKVLWNDGWDGYPAARQRLTDALKATRAPNPVLLGGDVHEHWVGHVKADHAKPTSDHVGVEFCGTSITSRGGSAARAAAALAENPHFVFADAEHRGYGIAEFTPGRLEVALKAVARIDQPDSAVDTLARFQVAAGRPVVERV